MPGIARYGDSSGVGVGRGFKILNSFPFSAKKNLRKKPAKKQHSLQSEERFGGGTLLPSLKILNLLDAHVAVVKYFSIYLF